MEMVLRCSSGLLLGKGFFLWDMKGSWGEREEICFALHVYVCTILTLLSVSLSCPGGWRVALLLCMGGQHPWETVRLGMVRQLGLSSGAQRHTC